MSTEKPITAIPYHEWFTLKEAAEVLNRSPATIQRWISFDQIRGYYIRERKGRLLHCMGYVIHRTEIEKVLAFGPSLWRRDTPKVQLDPEELKRDLQMAYEYGKRSVEAERSEMPPF